MLKLILGLPCCIAIFVLSRFALRPPLARTLARIGRSLIPISLRTGISFRIRLRQGKEVRIPHALDTGFAVVCWRPDWKTQLIDALAPLTPGTFVDGGASIGHTMLDWAHARHNGDYVGFDPSVHCCSFLQQLISMNDWQQHLIAPVALSSSAGMLPLYSDKDTPTDGGATIIPDLLPTRICDISFVACFPLDGIWSSLRMKHIGFVKLDVEGAELEALSGMQSLLVLHRPPILCEVLFCDAHADLRKKTMRNEQLTQLLDKLKYASYQIIKSVDEAKVIALTPNSSFAPALFTAENARLCDYLFVPMERERELVSAIRLRKSKSQ